MTHKSKGPKVIKKEITKVALHNQLPLSVVIKPKPNSKAIFHNAQHKMGHYTCICGMMGQIYILMSRSYSISHKCIIKSFFSILICIASYICQLLQLSHMSESLKVSFKQSNFPWKHTFMVWLRWIYYKKFQYLFQLINT